MSNELQHTSEPWKFDWPSIYGADEMRVASVLVPARSVEENKANTRRIAAAVNACKGVATEALEEGIFTDLISAVQNLMRDVTPALQGAFPKSEWSQSWKEVSDILAKATGEKR